MDLISFAGVKSWERAAFYAFGKQYGVMGVLSKPILFDMLKHDLFKAGKLTHEQYVSFLDEENRHDILTVCALETMTSEQLQKFKLFYRYPIMPDNHERIGKFLRYLNGLSAFWRWIIEDTRDNGPQVLVLNYIMRMETEFVFESSENPWRPKFSMPKKNGYLEEKLATAYVEPFVNGDGEIYRRIRTCSDPDCEKLFIYNRPKQNFCNDECRYHFHNVVKTRNGYLAEHQRRGRKDNPATYLRK